MHLLKLESFAQEKVWRQEKKTFGTVDSGETKDTPDVAGTGLEVRPGPEACNCGQGIHLRGGGQDEMAGRDGQDS